MLSKIGETIGFRAISHTVATTVDNNALITANAVVEKFANMSNSINSRLGEINSGLNGKQDKLNFPNEGGKALYSTPGGGYEWRELTISCDNEFDSNSVNAVENRVITVKINGMDAEIAKKFYNPQNQINVKNNQILVWDSSIGNSLWTDKSHFISNSLNAESSNAVQNKVVTIALNSKISYPDIAVNKIYGLKKNTNNAYTWQEITTGGNMIYPTDITANKVYGLTKSQNTYSWVEVTTGGGSGGSSRAVDITITDTGGYYDSGNV